MFAVESQQHLFPFAGTSEKCLRPFKKGTVLSHRHSGSKIIELCGVTRSLTSDLRSPAAGCYTDSWLLQITVALLAFSMRAFIPGLTPHAKVYRRTQASEKTTYMRTAFCPWWHKPSWAQSLASMQIVVSFKCEHPGTSGLLLSCMTFSATGSKNKQFALNTGLLTGVAVLYRCRILGDGTASNPKVSFSTELKLASWL